MATSRFSDRILRVLLSAATVFATAAAVGRQQQEQRFEGEHGLLVFVRGDSLHVHWLTSPAAPGRLEVVDSDRAKVLATVETPARLAHHAALPLPAARDVILRYGTSAASRRHETRVSLGAPARSPTVMAATDSLYVVGDTHGMYDELITGLHNAGLIDAENHWIAGRKQLVFAGDLVDRGPDVLQLLWFVYRLEREAAAAGGRVHVVLGNHEIMVMLNDLRYVNPKEMQVADLHAVPYDRVLDVRTSVLGRWLASKPAALRIGRVLVAHGGITDHYAKSSLQQLDDTLRTYMNEELFYRWADTSAVVNMDSASFQRRVDFFWADSSLFWHRGYVQSDTLQNVLTDVLRRLDADMLVVGHTPLPTATARYDGRVIAAHSMKYGGELVLIVRKGRTYERYRLGQEGPPIPF